MVLVPESPIEVKLQHRLMGPPNLLRNGKEYKSRLVEQAPHRLKSQLALAFTCRQIYLEAVAIYYGMNVFQGGSILPAFLDAIGPANTNTIRSLNSTETLYSVKKTVPRLQGLRHLKLVGGCLGYMKYFGYFWRLEGERLALPPMVKMPRNELYPDHCHHCREYYRRSQVLHQSKKELAQGSDEPILAFTGLGTDCA